MFITIPLSIFVVLIALSLTIFALATLRYQLYAWQSPGNFDAVYFDKSQVSPRYSFSLIVPVREEPENVLQATIDALLAQDHPDFEIIISVGGDDLSTKEIAYRIARQSYLVTVSECIDYRQPNNKPKQLNVALAACTKDIVGVFDAESIAAPGILSGIDRCFQRYHSDAVQGAVQLVNFKDSWYALQNCLEYRQWFRSRLHGHAAAGFIPLGGNTVFIKREILEDMGGWDSNCLAEDCDLGVRLSVRGKKITVAYDPSLITREETPDSIRALIRQRTRWALGFMQVVRKRDWTQLPTRAARFKAWFILTQQHWMAITGACLPLAIVVAVTTRLPFLVVFTSFLPSFPLILMVITNCVVLAEFGKDFGYKIRFRDYVRLIISVPLYQVILAIAAVSAWNKLRKGDLRWAKTSHAGAHLSGQYKEKEIVA